MIFNFVPVLLTIVFGSMFGYTGNYLYGIVSVAFLVLDALFYSKERKNMIGSKNYDRIKAEILKEITSNNDIAVVKNEVMRLKGILAAWSGREQ